MTENETVLCIKRQLLPQSWVEQKSIVPMTLEEFTKNCAAAGFRFTNRPDAEKDASYKQIIPYIVLQTTDLSRIAVYKRRGSEQRLHHLWSVGIGGHINPVDREKHVDASFDQILLTGMTRELNEELEKRPEDAQPSFIGVISEDITDVGKVHLGAVFRILTHCPEKFLPGSELFEFTWKKSEQLDQLNLELWSTLALELITQR